MRPYYQNGGITIYHGDCREVMPSLLTPIDLVLTDPPYGVSGERNSRNINGEKKNDYGTFTDSTDYVRQVCVPAIEFALSISRRAILTPGNRCLTFYPAPDSFGCFYQVASVGLQRWGRADSQPIFYYGSFPRDSKLIPGQPLSYILCEGSEKNGHPCPKPRGAWMRLMQVGSLDDAIVLDPFLGSGTTTRIAKDLGRRAIGIEIEERYCEIAANRLSQEVLAL